MDQENSQFSLLAKETLDDLDWCLGQLSTMKSRMSVSSMARNKFRSMMNEQLSTTIGDDDLVDGIENGRKKSNHQTKTDIWHSDFQYERPKSSQLQGCQIYMPITL